MRISSLFREDKETSRPLPFDLSVWLRGGVLVVLILATLCVLFVSLFQAKSGRLDVANYIIKIIVDYTDANAALREILFLFFAVLFTSIHLAYLYLVFVLLIFSSPPAEIYLQKILIPLFLILAYASDLGYELVFNVVNIFSSIYPTQWQFSSWAQKDYHALKKVSYLFFVLVYAYWLGRDLAEKKRCRDPRRIWEIKRWVIFEIIILVALTVRFGSEVRLYALGDVPTVLSDKSIAIGFCLMVWISLNFFTQGWKIVDYKHIYKDYLDKNNAILCGAKALIDWNKVSSVLDFGCANGKRLCDTLNYLGFDNSRKLNIVGYDNNDNWEFDFNKTIKSNNYEGTFVAYSERLLALQYNLIIFSHMLYDSKIVKEAIQFLKKCNPDTYVVIRGISPKSFFSAVNAAYSVRVKGPTKSHLWDTKYLRKVEEEANLVPIDRTKSPQAPDLIIKQDYCIDEGGIKFAGDLLNYLYKWPTGEITAEYFKTLRNLGIISVPNDDLIYVYEIVQKESYFRRCLRKCLEFIKKTLHMQD